MQGLPFHMISLLSQTKDDFTSHTCCFHNVDVFTQMTIIPLKPTQHFLSWNREHVLDDSPTSPTSGRTGPLIGLLVCVKVHRLLNKSTIHRRKSPIY
eukprot:m.157331 g.157331  ORF g.157331 m.157331 type:complete len:97 (+) comp17967_c0_seq1:1632-1922(+)